MTQQVLQGMGLAGVPQAGSNTLLVAATHGGAECLEGAAAHEAATGPGTIADEVNELGFIMQAHRYRSGLQRYKAARNPLAVLVFVREFQKCSAQTPA